MMIVFFFVEYVDMVIVEYVDIIVEYIDMIIVEYVDLLK